MTYIENNMKIVWGDIESTGLDENEDVILEVGLRVTDWWGVEKQRITLPIWNPGWRRLIARDTDSARYVRDMHIKSWLMDELGDVDMSPKRHASFGVEAQEIRLVDWFDEHAGITDGPIDGKYAFAGNSVSMDRRFLARHMPRLNDRFHYRIIDMSAIGEACRYVNPALHARLVECTSHPVTGMKKAHRPQGDIDDSIVLWQFYIDNFFHEGQD